MAPRPPRGLGFLFPELGYLRRHLALGAEPELPVQLVAVIYLRAWPVLPGVRRSIHFRSSQSLEVTVSLSGWGRDVCPVPGDRPQDRCVRTAARRHRSKGEGASLRWERPPATPRRSHLSAPSSRRPSRSTGPGETLRAPGSVIPRVLKKSEQEFASE